MSGVSPHVKTVASVISDLNASSLPFLSSQETLLRDSNARPLWRLEEKGHQQSLPAPIGPEQTPIQNRSYADHSTVPYTVAP